MIKKRFLILMLFVFLLAITSVNAQCNDTFVMNAPDNDTSLEYAQDDKLETTYFYDDDTGKRYVDDTVETRNVVKYYGDKSKKFKVTVYDNDYNLESGVYVEFGRDWGSLVEKRTNSNGVVSFPINYGVGKHSVMTYIECEDYDDGTPNYNYYLARNTVTVKTTIPTNAVSKHINEKNKKFSVKFLNTKGKVLAGKTVKIRIKGKTYNVRTDSRGIAKIRANYKKVGTYKMVAINPVTGEKKNIKVKILSKYKVRSVMVNVVKLKPGEYFSIRSAPLIKGDRIICFKEYKTKAQYPRGVNIDYWYCGKYEDIEPHHTVLLKAKLYYKNSAGKVIVKTKNAQKGGWINAFPFVKGYNPYKVKVWYRDK